MVQVRSTPKMILNNQKLSNQVLSIMKTIQDYDVTNCTVTVYVKNETKLT